MEMEAPMRVASKNAEAPGSGRDRVLLLLKRDGPQATAQVAQQLGVTAMAVRQHLSVLYGEGLVEFSDEQRKIGRPARIWRLTPKANARFPDHHAGLAVEMLQVVQSTFGEEGLERLTDGWTRKQVAPIARRCPARTCRSTSGWPPWSGSAARKVSWPSAGRLRTGPSNWWKTIMSMS
ncbi:metalloregulator ArsR/SmtB family transcription factor [Pseudomonas sp. R5(2019)]|uniref:helix-turn-helix transcriptional regulator n=1 Tax=Pseudomonas sp. R5(2019) TaxID=2697566 RepID=UPI0014131BF4|nr:ArsR family transcriptional regulator [Pseudomonas sp. R5(2019)]NBA93527.1 ArsR family transcriptional regulator [Pseudomonas sp. R5(2019)]